MDGSNVLTADASAQCRPGLAVQDERNFTYTVRTQRPTRHGDTLAAVLDPVDEADDRSDGSRMVGRRRAGAERLAVVSNRKPGCDRYEQGNHPSQPPMTQVGGKEAERHEGANGC